MTREGSVSLRTPELSWAVAGVGVFPSAGVFSMCLRAIFNTRTSTWRAREEPRTSPRTPLCRSQHTTSHLIFFIFSVCRVRARPHKRERHTSHNHIKKSMCAGEIKASAQDLVLMLTQNMLNIYIKKLTNLLCTCALLTFSRARTHTVVFSWSHVCAPRLPAKRTHGEHHESIVH